MPIHQSDIRSAYSVHEMYHKSKQMQQIKTGALRKLSD